MMNAVFLPWILRFSPDCFREIFVVNNVALDQNFLSEFPWQSWVHHCSTSIDQCDTPDQAAHPQWISWGQHLCNLFLGWLQN